MINRIVRLSLDPLQVENFCHVFRRTEKSIASFEGCQGVRLLRDIRTPNIFFTYSLWESEQALENYRQSELFTQTWAEIKPWFTDKPLAWSLAPMFE